MPGHSGELECHDGVRSTAKAHGTVLRQIQPCHWCVRPPLASYLLIVFLPPLEAGQTMYRAHRKHVVVRAWPRHPGPLPCPLRRVGLVPTTTAQAVLRGRRAFHHTRLR